MTLRKKIEQVYESSGGKVKDPLLDKEVLIPIEGQYIFELFWRLRACIGGSGFGPNPISNMEIMAWMLNMGVNLSPGEIRTIQKLDSVYMDYVSKKTESKKQS